MYVCEGMGEKHTSCASQRRGHFRAKLDGTTVKLESGSAFTAVKDDRRQWGPDPFVLPRLVPPIRE